ncbi:MAG TPA: EamA family transporter [Casimicrobiaceae bacterium]|nr:EamA family transporter [Casimicrobiaceae bacterium]
MKYLATLFVFVLYAALSTYGLYKIKAAPQILDPGFVVGFGAYGAGFLVWFYILRTTPLSLAFPVAAGTLILCTSLVGVLLLAEKANPLKLAGIVLIVVGIAMMFLGEDS